MRTSILITALVLLLAANFLMMYVTPFGMTNLQGFKDASGNNFEDKLEAFASKREKKRDSFVDASGNKQPFMNLTSGFIAPVDASGYNFQDMDTDMDDDMDETEGFTTYTLANGGGAGESYQAMGAFDGIRLKTGNSSSWRYTSPNESLNGPEFKPDADNLFIFKNNQCKPECCGASFSCDGGCVCTTAQQRDYINQRGGNRTLPDDSV